VRGDRLRGELLDKECSLNEAVLLTTVDHSNSRNFQELLWLLVSRVDSGSDNV
jgi:hypothetical protein